MSETPDSGRPPIHRVPSHHGAEPPQATDAPYLLDRYSVLAHELANLLDGSQRTLVLAQRSLDDSGDPQTIEAEALRRRLETVHRALERMTDLVRASSAGSHASLGSPATGPRVPITLAEAAHHAADVLGPLAEERGVRVALEIRPEAGVLPAGSLYTVILNGLRNAIDAVGAASFGHEPASDAPAGHVDMRIDRCRDGQSEVAVIEIADTGHGPHPHAGERAFGHGYTTKPGGHGIGLALSRQIVEHAGGTITLSRRSDRADTARPGAMLRVVVPIRTEATP